LIRKCGRRGRHFTVIVVSISFCGLISTVVIACCYWFNDDEASSVGVTPTDASRRERQQHHLARRCRVFRGFDELVDDAGAKFNDKEDVHGKSVDYDELDVIEQCYGVKPILMSEESFSRTNSGKSPVTSELEFGEGQNVF
jgi:hypothetical protein